MPNVVRISASGGFTAIELMIAVAIIAILSAFAIPSYRDYVQRGNRSEAITNLTQMAMLIEQHRALYGTYCLSSTCTGGGSDTFVYTENADGSVASASMGSGQNYLSGFRPKQATTGTAIRYNYQAVVTNNGYDLTATAVTSRNVPDTTLALDEEGVKKETPTGGSAEYGW